MLLVKFSAEDLRLIDRAKSDAEVAGVLTMVKDRVAQYALLKQFGKTPAEKKESFGWAAAFAVCEEVLGKDNVTKPPFPDYRWFQRINTVLRENRFGELDIRRFAEYARDRLRMPVSFDFLICQHKRVLSGEFDGAKQRPRRDFMDYNGHGDGLTPKSVGPELPED